MSEIGRNQEPYKNIEGGFRSNELNSSLEVQKVPLINQIEEKLKGLHPQGYEASISFIDTLPQQEQQFILDTLESNFQGKMYIKKNGYPNKETYPYFKNKFFEGKSNTEDSLETHTLNKQIIEEKQERRMVGGEKEGVSDILKATKNETKEFNKDNVNKLITIRSQLSSSLSLIKDSQVQGFVKDLSKLTDDFSNPQNKELFDKISGELLSGNGLLEKTLRQCKEIDEQNAKNGKKTDVYGEIKTSFLSFDSSLQARIEKFEKFEAINFQTLPTTLPKAQTTATLGTETPKQIGSILSNDGVNVDISKNPPVAFMSSEGGYKIPLDMPVGEFYPATVRFETVRQKLEPQINILNSTGGDLRQAISNMQGVESVQDKRAVVESLKMQLRGKLGEVYEELRIGEKQDVNEIVKAISQKRDSLQHEIQLAYANYQGELKELAKKYAEGQKISKEALKNRLNFISSIGFDVIPQEISDMILSEVNREAFPGLRTELGMTEPVNIANGDFGVKNEDPNRLAPNEKEAFIKLINKMFSGKTDAPIPVSTFASDTTKGSIDKGALKEKLAALGIFPNKEKWDIEKIRQNLKKGKESKSQ